MKSTCVVLPLAFSFLLLSSPSSAHNKTHKSSSSSSSSSSLRSSYKGCFSNVYAFGDSYTDTGNAHFLGTLPSFTGSKNSPYSTNRLCDGRLVVDFLCDALALPPLPPYKATTTLNSTSGVNFALAGSTTLSRDFFANYKFGDFPLWKDVPLSIQTQIDWFNRFHTGIECKGKDADACRAKMKNTLFWIGEIGVSDYAINIGSSVSARYLTEKTVTNVCKLIQTLLDNGATYIVVQGLPPVGCFPLAVSACPVVQMSKAGCDVIVNSAIMIHNEILEKNLEKFQKRYPDRTIIYADFWNAYLTVLMNPPKFGFEDPFKACCGAGGGKYNFKSHSLCGSPGTSTCKDPSKYISWDGIHLTEAMYKQVADLFLNQGFCRPSFDQMVKNKSGI
ncbi:hypothetical protein RJ640_030745 [Escallonia rubra]|uniref:Uncharacterized protein n=1 Tax=Escallonia rubra TaxID=112253 RepID=A0AA88QZ48_9ASTE|nr:hypothetical protein RJ640_030745 [Escallonia rubra]